MEIAREVLGKGKPPKHPGGAPSKFERINLKQLATLAETGMTDKEMAHFFGISERSFAYYKKKNPEFLQSLKKGKEIADSKVERSLFERATGYEHPEEVIFNYQGKIIRAKTLKRYPPEVTACIFWLKNRMPDKWRDRHDVGGGMNLSVLRPIMLPDNGMNAKEPKGWREQR